MTSAPRSMPRLRPRATTRPSSGLLKATRRMNPKYATIMAMVSEMAMRHRAAETASREVCEGVCDTRELPRANSHFPNSGLGVGSWRLGDYVLLLRAHV